MDPVLIQRKYFLSSVLSNGGKNNYLTRPPSVEEKAGASETGRWAGQRSHTGQVLCRWEMRRWKRSEKGKRGTRSWHEDAGRQRLELRELVTEGYFIFTQLPAALCSDKSPDPLVWLIPIAICHVISEAPLESQKRFRTPGKGMSN